MTRDQAREYIRSRGAEYFTPAGKNGYICPICGSGNGKRGTGITTRDKVHFTCWARDCFTNADIFEIIGKEKGLPDFNDQLRAACEIFHVSIDGTGEPVKPKPKPEKKPIQKEKILKDLATWRSHAGETDYFQKRGFTPEDVQRYGLGYDPEKKVIVLPYGEGVAYYQTRALTGHTFNKPATEYAGPEPIFNASALRSPEPCWICEGPIDALSIMAGEGSAIALGGTGIEKLRKSLEEERPACPLIPCMDKDEAGKAATEKREKLLQEFNIPYSLADLPYIGEEKDPNDILRRDRAELAEAVKKTAQALQETEADKKAEEHRRLRGSGRLEKFLQKVTQQTENPVLSTGWGKLDAELDGGLYPELCIIGAVPSLGKTTFILQMADHIAKQGKEVLFFSMEMGAEELIARSLSRLTRELGSEGNAKTARGISSGWKWGNYSKEERDLISQAVDAYREYADNIIFIEGTGSTTIQEIRNVVQEHRTEQLGAIFLDYIQIVNPTDPRASDKQHVDNVVRELKRISRDFNIAVVAISAFNRANYNTGATMAAYKDSGSLEYGADVGLALVPEGTQMGKEEDNAITMETEKRNEIRSLEAVILKQRNGRTGERVPFTYHAKFNTFKGK